MDNEAKAKAVMRDISEELVSLRIAIAGQDVSAIEAHTHRTRDLLTDLRPLLTRQRLTHLPEHLQLRNAIRACGTLVAGVRRTFRALHGFHQTVLHTLSGTGTYEVRR